MEKGKIDIQMDCAEVFSIRCQCGQPLNAEFEPCGNIIVQPCERCWHSWTEKKGGE